MFRTLRRAFLVVAFIAGFVAAVSGCSKSIPVAGGLGHIGHL
jgi:hypothetical protein